MAPLPAENATVQAHNIVNKACWFAPLMVVTSDTTRSYDLSVLKLYAAYIETFTCQGQFLTGYLSAHAKGLLQLSGSAEIKE